VISSMFDLSSMLLCILSFRTNPSDRLLRDSASLKISSSFFKIKILLSTTISWFILRKNYKKMRMIKRLKNRRSMKNSYRKLNRIMILMNFSELSIVKIVTTSTLNWISTELRDNNCSWRSTSWSAQRH